MDAIRRRVAFDTVYRLRRHDGEYRWMLAAVQPRYDECGAYVDAFGDRVIVVEYRVRDFRRTCAAWGDRLPVVLRDLDLRPGGLRRWC